MRGEGLHRTLEETDSQRVGATTIAVIAKNATAKKSADLFNQSISEATKMLKNEPKANGLSSCVDSQPIPAFRFSGFYGLRAAYVVPCIPCIRGVSQLVGMDIIKLKVKLRADEFKAGRRSLE